MIKNQCFRLSFFIILMNTIGCSPTEDYKHINENINSFKNYYKKADLPENGSLVFIPADGCSYCKGFAINFIKKHHKDLNQVAYVFVTNSGKQVKLALGHDIFNKNTIFIDSSRVSLRFKLCDNYPVIYYLKSGEAYKQHILTPKELQVGFELLRLNHSQNTK